MFPLPEQAWTAADAILAYRLRRKGLSNREIGLALGRSPGAVSRKLSRLRRRGIPIPPSQGVYRKTGLPLDMDKILAMRRAGRFHHEIAAVMGVHMTTIWRRLRPFERPVPVPHPLPPPDSQAVAAAGRG